MNEYLSSLTALAGTLGVIGLAGVLATPIAMFKISQIDGRNPIVWTIITILITVLVVYFIGGVFSGPIALIVSFILMWAYKASCRNLYE